MSLSDINTDIADDRRMVTTSNMFSSVYQKTSIVNDLQGPKDADFSVFGIFLRPYPPLYIVGRIVQLGETKCLHPNR